MSGQHGQHGPRNRLLTILVGAGAAAVISAFVVSAGGSVGRGASGTPYRATYDAAAETFQVQRLQGTDSIGTAIAVSQAEFPGPGSAGAVVLARSDDSSDALAGGPLAAKVGGPLLLTPGASLSASLDPRVQAEIQRVLAPGGTVYILGGDLALSPAIDSALNGMSYSTVRIAGSDSYATAVDIAQRLGDPSTVFEVSGAGFADALSAVPAAIEDQGAILLTDGSQQAPETAWYLLGHPGDTRYAIGDEAVAADPSATPVKGGDAYGTSAAVASRFFPTAKTFGVANGTSFGDGLTGGAFMGSSGGPLLLVEPSGPLPQAVESYLSSGSNVWTTGYVFGGTEAVGDDVLSDLRVAEPPNSTAAPTPTTTAPNASTSTTQPSVPPSSTTTTTQPSAPPSSTTTTQPAPQSSATPSALDSGAQATNLVSANWSGYVTVHGPFSHVSGTFTVPTPTGPTSDLGEWVGIGGYSDSPLIQAGVAEFADPSNPQHIVAQPWWEILPANPVTVNISSVDVSLGDSVTVTIDQMSSGQWAITLTDDTNGQSFTTDQSFGGPASSAEWIVEAPLSGGIQTALPPFSPAVTFSSLEVTGDQTALGRMVMDVGQTAIATPSALTPAGFTVAYGATEPAAP